MLPHPLCVKQSLGDHAPSVSGTIRPAPVHFAVHQERCGFGGGFFPDRAVPVSAAGIVGEKPVPSEGVVMEADAAVISGFIRTEVIVLVILVPHLEKHIRRRGIQQRHENTFLSVDPLSPDRNGLAVYPRRRPIRRSCRLAAHESADAVPPAPRIRRRTMRRSPPPGSFPSHYSPDRFGQRTKQPKPGR